MYLPQLSISSSHSSNLTRTVEDVEYSLRSGQLGLLPLPFAAPRSCRAWRSEARLAQANTPSELNQSQNAQRNVRFESPRKARRVRQVVVLIDDTLLTCHTRYPF
jgi:hypothetical protein